MHQQRCDVSTGINTAIKAHNAKGTTYTHNTQHLVSQFTVVKLRLLTEQKLEMAKHEGYKWQFVLQVITTCLETIPPLLSTPSPGPHTSCWIWGSHSNMPCLLESYKETGSVVPNILKGHTDIHVQCQSRSQTTWTAWPWTSRHYEPQEQWPLLNQHTVLHHRSLKPSNLTCHCDLPSSSALSQ